MKLELVGKCKVAIEIENVNFARDGKLCGCKGMGK